ncbi:MAG: homocysteine S-methyltransferase family protein [Deltaproteobacteria bacterium]|nr:homocysteine S-methyltransferase family protein [Deltaproteobacteria bacterium]
MTPSPPFMLADGAVGRLLQNRIGPKKMPVEALNLSRPEAVKQAHLDYLAAGCTLHRTNTLCANRPSLAPYFLEDRTEAMNTSAVALIHQAAGPEATVMASIGQITPPGGAVPLAELEKGYSEQMIYLSDAMADFFLFTHFTLLSEALLALRLAKSASDAPVLAQMTFDAQGFTADGVGCREAAVQLAGEGADGLGISCRPGGKNLMPILDQLSAPGLPLGVMLSGEGLTPDAFADLVTPLAGRVAILGGCCGATPDHLARVAQKERHQPA